MYLIPEVKEIDTFNGSCKLADIKKISIKSIHRDLFHAGTFLQKRIMFLTGHMIPIMVSEKKSSNEIYLDFEDFGCSETYSLKIDENGIAINGKSPKALFWGIQTLLQIIQQYHYTLPCLKIEDEPDFKHRGFYHDVTRGKVPKLSTLKWLVEKCAYYKINELQLYVEHSFAFKCVPELWTGKDPLTAQEILELDEYCRDFHIDLIPSMATFGHLYELLRLRKYQHLNELEISAADLPHDLWDRMAHYTIDPSNEESFNLIKLMIEEYLPLFSSEYFNICCDETFDLGKGRNKALAHSGVERLYIDFVKRIAELVISNGKIPMMWGDIVLNHRDLIHELPSQTVFLNWEYGADVTEEATRNFSEAGVTQIVCPGVQGWSRFACDIDHASTNIRKKIQYGVKFNADGVLNTDWGDCGHINFVSGALHGMALGAALSWNSSSVFSDTEFDRAISLLEWKDRSSELASLLRELGNLCSYHFGNIYAWVNNKDCLWNKEEELKNMDSEILLRNYFRADEIQTKLLNLKKDNRLDFLEFMWSAKMIKWTLAALLFKKEKEYRQEVEAPLSGNELIETGCFLLDEFIFLWRERNKESELCNIVSTFRSVFDRIWQITQSNQQ